MHSLWITVTPLSFIWLASPGNGEVEGKQNSLLPAGPDIKRFVIPPNSKIEKTNTYTFLFARRYFYQVDTAEHSPNGHEITIDVYSSTFFSFYFWHLAKLWRQDRCTTRSVWAFCICQKIIPTILGTPTTDAPSHKPILLTLPMPRVYSNPDFILPGDKMKTSPFELRLITRRKILILIKLSYLRNSFWN